MSNWNLSTLLFVTVAGLILLMLSMYLIFLLILRTSTNPVPSSTTDLSTDVSLAEEFDDSSTSININMLNNPRCAADESTQSNSKLDKRGTGSCPTTGIKSSVGQGSWRAPDTLPEIDPSESTAGDALSREFCGLPWMPVLLSCSSPEIVYDSMIIGYVLNCVPGKFSFQFKSIQN